MFFRPSALSRGLLAFSVVVGCGGLAALAAPPVERDHWVATSYGDRRVVLSYVEQSVGPRLLTFTCQRGAGLFLLTIDGLEGIRPHFTEVHVSLMVGARAFVRTGKVSTDETTGRRIVTVELGTDEAVLKQIEADLMPVLGGNGPGAVVVADLRPRNVMFAAGEKKGSGPSPLQMFSKTCFGAS